jgi:hypothetical protein
VVVIEKGTNMSYNLFIDDERDPIDVAWGTWQERELYRSGDWLIARNWSEVLELIISWGLPSLISFDHDLGDGTPNGHEIAKRLSNLIMDAKYELPKDFRFLVHSKNPVGAENIRAYMDGFLKAYERMDDIMDVVETRIDELLRSDIGYEEESNANEIIARNVRW